MFKKEKNLNIMFLRAQTLYGKFCFVLDNIQFTNNAIKIFNGDYTKTIRVNTKLGARTFSMNSSEAYTGKKNADYELSMYDYTTLERLEGVHIFTIVANKDSLEVLPMLTHELTAKDIDLAILELETILDETIKQIKSESHKHNLEVEKLRNGRY